MVGVFSILLTCKFAVLPVGASVVSGDEELQLRVGQQSGKLSAGLDVSKQFVVSGFSPDFKEGQL